MNGLDFDSLLTDLITQSILPPNCTYEPLSGGTLSEVMAIVCEGERRYVLKLGEAGVLAAEVAYLQRYRGNSLLPRVKYVGVIDPFPVIGEPIYDLIYAFCSTPDDLDLATLTPALALLRHWQQVNATVLHHELLLGLYLRFGKCIRHHEEDLPRYLAVWERWKMSLMNEKDA